MSFSATINGVTVESDMNPSVITGTRVEFPDGSWCDVATGQVVNKGRGTISMGGSGFANSEPKTIGPMEFSAQSLEITDMPHNVTIEPHDGPNMEVTLAGPESVVEGVNCYTQGSVLVIGGAKPGQTESSIIIGNSNVRASFIGGLGGVMNISADGVSIVSAGSTGNGRSTHITVKVPIGTNIAIGGACSGYITIGAVNGDLSLATVGSSAVRAASVRNLTCARTGSGRTTIPYVSGNVTLANTGSGWTRILGGLIDTLTVNVTGSGDVDINCMAKDAFLTKSGSCTVTIDHVINVRAENAVGTGSIKIKRRG